MTTDTNQISKWILPRPINKEEINNCELNNTLQKVLLRRGINLNEDLVEFLSPSELPNPEEHFIELNKASERIINACNNNEGIAICGDYDADGMTSTILLVELLNKLGAKAKSFIPSRKDDGYGLNLKMVNDINNNGIKLIITVDNGVSAYEAIKRSNELNIDLIITDHHKITDKNLEIYALIHPEKVPLNSPYKYLAGVGIAFMIAKYICKKVNFNIDKTTASTLFCIGTIADMAPLVGANRTWLKQFLPQIQYTYNIGIRAIIKRLGLENSYITPDDIGFKIAPLINAVGRIGEPKLIVDLLTNTSEGDIKKLVKKSFEINKERKEKTAEIQKEALEIAYREYENKKQFLVLCNKEWHPGIIGIVAARIAETFNLPTAIVSAANNGLYRGSIRSNNKLNVILALNECKEILIAHGGHSAAAGFTIKEENITKLKEMLNNIAIKEFKNFDIGKSIKPDAHVKLKDINDIFYEQLMLMGPFGIMNKTPIFWTRKCRVIELYNLKGNHMKMKLDDGTGFIDAIKWNFSSQLKINDLIDVAFSIEINNWKNVKKIQLNLIDIRQYHKIVDLELHKRNYKCQITNDMNIKVTNSKGQCITSPLPIKNEIKILQDDIFTNKMLSFAEVALGQTA